MICVVTWLHLLDSPMHHMHRKAKVQTVQKSNRLLISTVTREKKQNTCISWIMLGLFVASPLERKGWKK